MVRKELLQIRPLKATPKMLKVARGDGLKKVVSYRYNGKTHYEKRRSYYMFMRCCIENDILKVALFYPDAMRAGGRLPYYEVYIDHNARQFITYDSINQRWLQSKLDRLSWPDKYYFSSTWISSADARTIAEYLGAAKGGYSAILDYQLEIRKEARIRHHKKETDPWDADVALTPALPKDWNRWVDKVGIPQNYIFYEYKRHGTKHGYCSYCEKDVPLHNVPRHNKEGLCPCCRHKIIYKAVGRLNWHLDTDEVCVYLIQPRPDGFVIREFWASRRYLREDYKNPEVSCTERWHSIYDAELNRRTYYWGNYKQMCLRWIEGQPPYSWMGYNSIYNYHGHTAGRVYGKTLPRLQKTWLKHTGLVEWIYGHGMVVNPSKYLSICREIPQFEQIWKANLFLLAEECIHCSSTVKLTIKKPEASSLTKALGIDKRQLAILREKNGGCDFLRWLQWEKESGKPISADVVQWFCEQKIPVHDLSFIQGKMHPIQVRNYLQRQASDNNESIQRVFTTWQDYLSMAKRLGIDVDDEIVYRVKLLFQRHNELVLRCKYRNKEEQASEVLSNFPKVDQICQSIKGKYEYGNENYAVVAPNGVLDIIVEGDFLNHCLRGSDRYWDRIQTYESYILFLRRASAVDIPYYTLEVEPDGTIRQKRTNFDRQEEDIKDAEKFLEEWQNVVAKRLTEQDRKRAATSRVLREQEFEQMRRDNVIIHTGNLAGQRLVDVLMADLMETAA